MKYKTRTLVSFDKISVTLQIEDSYKLKLKDKLLEGLETYKEKGRIAKHYFNQERYGNVFRFEIPTDTHEGHFVLKILIYPLHKSHNFFKIEFNPNKLGSKGGRKILRIMKIILGAKKAGRIYSEGRITRIDLAIDVYQHINCFMLVKGAVKSRIIVSKSGEIESQIAGSKASNSHTTLYNKVVEQANLNRKCGHEVWYRLEIVMRKLDISIAEIPENLPNYFKKISFYRTTLLDDDYFDQGFLALVRTYGLNTALHTLDRNTRASYFRQLDEYKYEPFNLRKLSITQGVESLSFLDPENLLE